jgi:hypothetical protein
MNDKSLKSGIFIFVMIFLNNPGIVYSADETRTVKYQQISSMDNLCVEKSIKISTDNMHFAYVSSNPAVMTAVFDKRQYTSYKEIRGDSLVLSPDGRHLAYIAKQWDKWFVVIDGKIDLMGNFNEIITESLTFSPDSKHLAYAALDSNKWHVVVDGKGSASFDEIKPGTLAFSPDNKHLAYAAEIFNKWYIFVDGAKGKEYDYIPDWSKIVWNSPTTLTYLLLDVQNNVYVAYESLR